MEEKAGIGVRGSGFGAGGKAKIHHEGTECTEEDKDFISRRRWRKIKARLL